MKKYTSLLITPLIFWLLIGAITGIFNPANYSNTAQRIYAFMFFIYIVFLDEPNNKPIKPQKNYYE